MSDSQQENGNVEIDTLSVSMRNVLRQIWKYGVDNASVTFVDVTNEQPSKQRISSVNQ